MEIKQITDFGKNLCVGARTVARGTYKQAKKSFNNPVVRANAKNALPYAILSAGAFSLMSVLPNRVGDGKQGKLEKASGKIATIAFAAATFKKFFKAPNIKLKELPIVFAKTKFKDVLGTLKNNKENIVMYALMLAGVKIGTDLLTRGLDDTIFDEYHPRRLGD